MRVRFAPSPTGHLHVGNARTALFNWLLARGSDGVFVLRIEDTDVERSRAESEAGILRDLRWLGLDWDEGPDVGGPCGPYRSSERMHLYESYAKELLATGQAYPCFCSPEQLDAERRAAIVSGLPPRYSGRCRALTRDEVERRLAAGERPAVRFRVPENRDVVFADIVRGEVRFSTDVIGDLVIVRSEGTAAYNFAVVVDDALMQITHVVRGEDHISNTPRQLLLYEALGFAPPAFAHLALVMGPDHTPLSKRHGATSVAEFRARGYLPEALVNYLAMVGWSPRGAEHGAAGSTAQAGELQSIDAMAAIFSLEDVVPTSGVFDEEKLAWVNRHYLKAADPGRLADLAVPHFRQAGVEMFPSRTGYDFLASVIPIASTSVDRLDQVPARLAFLFEFAPARALADPQLAEEVSAPGAEAVLRSLAARLAARSRLDREQFRGVAAEIRAETGLKARALFHPIRVALTGRAEGPELDLAVPAIELGAELPAGSGIPSILGCRERAAMFVQELDRLRPRS